MRTAARNCCRALLVCGLTTAAHSVALGQQYPFLSVPGSPKGITALFQESNGRLWLGGEQPAIYDGARFFFLRDLGLPATAVHCITEDSSGAVWVGAESGLYRFASGKVQGR